jgi:hypothetical protein
VVSKATEFAVGGMLILVSLIPIGISILASVPQLYLGVIIDFGGLGVILGFLGFYLMGTALFRSD